MIEVTKERKFLHDIATPIAGLKLMIKRVHLSLSEGQPEMSQEQIIDRLERCNELIAQLENMHADFKMTISS